LQRNSILKHPTITSAHIPSSSCFIFFLIWSKNRILWSSDKGPCFVYVRSRVHITVHRLYILISWFSSIRPVNAVIVPCFIPHPFQCIIYNSLIWYCMILVTESIEFSRLAQRSGLDLYSGDARFESQLVIIFNGVSCFSSFSIRRCQGSTSIKQRL
jgi:hypothetical protein